MGASVGSGDKDSVDVELNVVPFIDLLSCLTAFLLMSAVWTAYSQINIKPKGLGKNSGEPDTSEIKNYGSILLTKNEIWIGNTAEGPQLIRNTGDSYNWADLEEVLLSYREKSIFADRYDIEIAPEDDVDYQTVITAMDYAIAAGFNDVGYLDPSSLHVKFKE